jgi:hypothetical protein
MLNEAKHLGWWGLTPPQMLRRIAPQHDTLGVWLGALNLLRLNASVGAGFKPAPKIEWNPRL